MKNMLFISSLDITGDRPETDGVVKKIRLEIKTFEEMGLGVDYVYIKDGKAYFCHYDSEDKCICNTVGRYYRDISAICRQLPSLIKNFEYDYLYIRYEGMSPRIVKFMRWIKRQHKGKPSIIAELPTFQAKWEPGTNFRGKINFIIRKFGNKLLSFPIDKIVTFDDQDTIFGRPTIKIENFADVININVKKNIQGNEDIHMVAIAHMTPSHGFDRVIKGLRIYYDTKPSVAVYFHIIGDGYVRPQWENLVRTLDLQKYVIFEGVKTSDEISGYIDKSHIAVGSLAFFRKHTTKGSELKIREYCARGIPFIYSANEPILDGMKWCYKVSFDETPICIQNVLAFIDSINYETTIPEIRHFAEKFCTPDSQLRKTL